MTPRELHAYATRLAVEAGADPERARERMAQLAAALTIECDLRDEDPRLVPTLPAPPCDACEECGLDGCDGYCGEDERDRERWERASREAYEREHSAGRLG